MRNGKPVIGLMSSCEGTGWTHRVQLPSSYLSSIRHFGGIPLLLPIGADREELEFLLEQCDGLILTGGNDIDPKRFGEEKWNDTVDITPERDETEFLLCDLAVNRELPILGICRGIQMLNVYFGGTLYQDVFSQLENIEAHRMSEPYHRCSHNCVLAAGSPLQSACGETVVGVNSHHHQAVKDIAPGFLEMGRCEDGVIEAIWNPSMKFCWGVQWHPERIWDIAPSSAKVFEAFIDACK